MNSLIFLNVTILIALLVVVVLLFRLVRTLQKLDSYCDTFEKVVQNAYQEQSQPAREIAKKLEATQDHLKTISRNIYVMAKVLMGDRREEEPYAAAAASSNTGSAVAKARAKESVSSAQGDEE